MPAPSGASARLAPLMELQRGTRLRQYELLVRIGRGGMASVWVARGKTTPGGEEQLVAIKAMLPELKDHVEFRSMFLDEGQIVRSIDHPNVVKVYDVAEDHGVMFMVMEWIEGDSLHALIAEANKRRPIPPEVAVRMVADTAGGLHAAHELRGWDGELREVVHCDVSPHNILVGLDGSVKLVDFGVAGAMNHLTDDDEAKIRGKFGYMSPEQAQAKALDRRSDVFSLGIVLFELTTGYRLFRGRDDRHTLDLVTFGKIPRPTQVVKGYSEKLEAIVMKALERDLSQRFQTADELRDALETYLVSERILVPSAGVKGLLRRVLGGRIDQRRDQVRSAIRSLDGSGQTTTWVSDDSVLDDGDAISVSVSAVEPLAASDWSGSDLGAARLPADSSSAGHSVSQPVPNATPKTSSMGFLVGAVVGIAIAAGAVVFVSQRDSKPTVTEMGPRRSAASQQNDQSKPNAESAPGAREEGTQSVSLDSLPSDGDEAARSGIPSSPRSGPQPGAAPAADTSQLERDIQALKEESEKSSRPKITLKEDSVEQIAQGVKLDDLDNSGASSGSSGGGFDRSAATSAVAGAANMVGMCYRPGGEHGTSRVSVTFGPNGRVQNVSVGAPFAGTAVGGCVASRFKNLKVSPFSGSEQTITRSVKVGD